MLPLATGLATVKAPHRSGEGCDLGALGGTRTPNLLIRRPMGLVRPVRQSPDSQVRIGRMSGLCA
jgi:hypothetical protein